MTCNLQDNPLAALLPLLTSGEDVRFRDALRLLLNAAMLSARQQHLRHHTPVMWATPYERMEERTGHASGLKARAFQTRVGNLDLRIPQVRDGSFYSQNLEKGLRSERALKIALAEMYVKGVSDRKVTAVTHGTTLRL